MASRPRKAAVALLRRPHAAVSLVVLVETREDEPPRVDVRLRVEADGSLHVEAPGGEGEPGLADRPGLGTCESLARLLAPLRPSPGSSRRALAGELGLLPLLAVRDVSQVGPAETCGRGRSTTCSGCRSASTAPATRSAWT